MRTVLVITTKEKTTYTVYDKRVALATYEIEQPGFLQAHEVEDIRKASYAEKA